MENVVLVNQDRKNNPEKANTYTAHTKVRNSAYYYTIYIFEWVINNEHIDTYDVELYLSTEPFTFSHPINNRHHVNTLVIKSHKYIEINQLTKYMKWKFSSYQLSPECHASAYEGYFPMINHRLNWIISIIDVEVDFHIGRRTCMRGANKKHLKEYMRSIRNGYHGPKVYY